MGRFNVGTFSKDFVLRFLDDEHLVDISRFTAGRRLAKVNKR